MIFDVPKKSSRLGGIYQIVCTVTGDSYIGQTYDFKYRYSDHGSLLSAGRHHNKRLQEAYVQHGSGNFVFSVLIIDNKKRRRELLESCIIRDTDPATTYNSRRY